MVYLWQTHQLDIEPSLQNIQMQPLEPHHCLMFGLTKYNPMLGEVYIHFD